MRGQQRKRPVRRFHPQLETLENRLVPSTAPFDHVLLLSVDGLHAADISDPALAPLASRERILIVYLRIQSPSVVVAMHWK